MGRVGFIKEKLKELKTQVESDEISYRKARSNALACG